MSRNVVTVGIAIAVAVSFLFVGVGAVAAHDGGTDVGASGNCDDGSNGGAGSVGVSQSGDVDDTNPSEVESVVNGLAFFFEQKQANPDRADTCDDTDETDDGGSPSDAQSYDYLEAHAGPGQFCYSEDNSGSQGDVSANGGDACH